MSKAITILKSELEWIAPKAVEEMISNTCGIKAAVKRGEDNRLLICLQHHDSAFEIMRRLRLDFDYSLHKRGKLYLIEL